MLAKKLLKIVREPSASSGDGNVSPAEGTPSETSESVNSSMLRPNLLSRKGSVWSQVARKLSTQKEQKSAVPRIRYENTYQLEPDEEVQFDCVKVRKFMEEVMEMRLKSESYNAGTCGSLTANLADVIKGRVKKMGFKRHKIVCHIVIGEKNRQDVNVCSRCVWDTKTDNSATAKYTNESIFAVATVYAVYFE